MKTESASPAEPVPASALASPRNVLVWDVPVRVFHWLMVLSFAGAYLTAESERWRLAHVTLGYTMGGLVAFRLVWGLIGSRHARFASFVRGPAAVVRYVRSMWGPQPEHHVGHNPAGALAIVLLLAMAVAVTASGWALYNELSGEWLEELHEVASNAMVDGRKAGTPKDAVRSAWRSVGVLMLVAVLGFWWLQWQSAPSGAGLADGAAALEHGADRDDD
jgi:cytochrome b